MLLLKQSSFLVYFFLLSFSFSLKGTTLVEQYSNTKELFRELKGGKEKFGKKWGRQLPEKVEKLLEAGVTLEGTDETGLTLLELAVKQATRAAMHCYEAEACRIACEHLIKKGSHVSKKSLSMAAYYMWNRLLLQALLKAKDLSCLEERDEKGMTELHKACLQGNRTAVYDLVNAGADMKATCFIEMESFGTTFQVKKATPLDIAIMHGKLSCVEALLSRGADFQKKVFLKVRGQVFSSSHSFPNALEFSNDLGQTEISAVISNWDLTIKEAKKSLWAKVETGKLAEVADALRSGLKPTYYHKQGWTALHFAAYYGHDMLVSYLVKKQKIDPDLVGQKGTQAQGITALQIASYWGRQSVVEVLLLNGANFDQLTPFDFPIFQDHFGDTT